MTAKRGVANIAHRGASGHAPEHTLEAYDLALELGADYIEQDLQMTADGVLVVLHDDELDRITKGGSTGPVIDKTLDELLALEVGSWFNEAHPDKARPRYEGLPIPSLEDVFDRYHADARYYIETKSPESAPGMADELLRLLDDYDLRAPAAKDWAVLIQSFDPASLQRFHALDPGLPLIQLGHTDPNDEALATVAEYAVGIGPPHGAVTKELVDAAHAHCLEIHPYTVNSPADMKRLIEWGVDAMFTDLPDVLAGVRGGARWSSTRAAARNRTCREP